MSKYLLNLDPDFTFSHLPEIKFESLTFPAGERHIKIKHEIDNVSEILITHRLNNSERIIELLLATDAVRRRFKDVKVSAVIPYIPFSRQDRPMIHGEPFSLKVFANLINSQNYERVYALEPHSDVSAALIDNLECLQPNYLLSSQVGIRIDYGENIVIISPDGGALKRIYKQAEFQDYTGDILCATKIRDLNTGKIVRTTIDATDDQIKGKVCVILDDICSYGGTFKALAKVLKERGAAKVILVVAHYEGVANEESLREYIDGVYTTNSILNYKTEFVNQHPINL